MPRAGREVPTCERCHGELEFLRQHTSTLVRAESLNVSDRVLRGSGHDFACTKCHTGFDAAYPHVKGRVSTASCASCHPEVVKAWSAGAHARLDKGTPAACKDCHGIHPVPPKAQLRSRATVALMNGRCLACHDAKRHAPGLPHADSISCAACHGAHDIRGHDQAGSTLAAANQLKTCGACHPAIAQSWSHDSHGRAVLAGREVTPKGETEPRTRPACTSCHGGHDMVRPKTAVAGTGPAAACLRCHEKYAETFADSYHGQATRLGSKKAAGCAGCHSAHSVLPSDSARSTVAKGNLLHTCRGCHPQATAGFIAFQPHADVHDRAKSPLLYFTYTFMTLLLTGTMAVFGLHGALWLARLGLGRFAAERSGSHGATTASRGGDA